jgi:hypothetical protein
MDNYVQEFDVSLPKIFRLSSNNTVESVFGMRELIRKNHFDHRNYISYLDSP